MREMLLQADPHLLQWLRDTLGRELEEPDDLEKITQLRAENFHWETSPCPGWVTPAPGDWSLIGALPRLEALEFPNIPDIGMRYSFARRGPTEFCWSGIESYSFLLRCRRLKYLDLSQTNFYEGWYLENLTQLEQLILPPAEFSDFSFLECCRPLTALDVSRTNFQDCRILARLPALKSALLPPKKNLRHYEAVEALAADVQTREPEPEPPGPPPLLPLQTEKSPGRERPLRADHQGGRPQVLRNRHHRGAGAKAGKGCKRGEDTQLDGIRGPGSGGGSLYRGAQRRLGRSCPPGL